MLIDKKYKRKIASYSNGSAFIITIPKEVKENMNLSTSFVAEMDFDIKKRIIKVFLKKTSSKKEGVIERKIMSINGQLVFTIPLVKAKELNIDDNNIITIDGNIEKKELIINIDGKDISTLNEVELK